MLQLVSLKPRASGSLLVFTSSSHWLKEIFSCYDWLLWLLWFRFYDSKFKSTLLILGFLLHKRKSLWWEKISTKIVKQRTWLIASTNTTQGFVFLFDKRLLVSWTKESKSLTTSRYKIKTHKIGRENLRTEYWSLWYGDTRIPLIPIPTSPPPPTPMW